MSVNARIRRAGLFALALLSLAGAAQAQPPLVIEPKVLENESTVTITVTSNGAFDLSGITRQKIGFRQFFQDRFEQSVLFPAKVDATASRLTVTANIPNRRQQGEQLMNIDFGDMIVSLKFTLAPPFVCPNCRPPGACVNKVCVFPPPSKCNPRCRPPRICNEELKRCEIPK